ncbi:MAG TPA: GntR family transcriptional regulator [Gracilimonas sp.]|uniref:GntR family transcriptional regulator n=1 Tax=Gracilimonas sp. TaxID=1974203 RepID=UPI002D9F72D2|nr:GntR family transcriptional regulator [Gracilimonas sp.]
MEFSGNKPIYKQIETHFYDQILNGKWSEGERVPSVREVAVLMEVNPNTAIRAFQDLQEEGILYNKRGVGYFVDDNALEKVKDLKREEFIQDKLPVFFKYMDQLEISFSDLKQLYSSQRSKK